jgi:hypothetical protein
MVEHHPAVVRGQDGKAISYLQDIDHWSALVQNPTASMDIWVKGTPDDRARTDTVIGMRLHVFKTSYVDRHASTLVAPSVEEEMDENMYWPAMTRAPIKSLPRSCEYGIEYDVGAHLMLF